MKLVINKNHQKEIAKFKKLIQKHRDEEDKLFDGLIASMHLDDKQLDFMWDHIYNDTSFNIEYEK
jgi:hypothetical protein